MGSNSNLNCESGIDTWSDKDLPQTVQCSPSNWSSVLVEELMETNVIGNESMSILKEQGNSCKLSDPVLLSDLRHDKDVRSALRLNRSQLSRSDIMMEARRILNKEDKTKKILHIQNKIVDEEVDRFQSHITNLRKMNQRLERIAFPVHNAPKKRKDKFHHQFEMNVHDLQKGSSMGKPIKELDDLTMCHMKDKLKNLKGKQNWNLEDISAEQLSCKKSSYLSDGPPTLKKRTPLSISGHKVDDHEILKHNPMPFSQISSEAQNTVFERIHQKYAESERDRVSKEGTTLIRHSSPIDEVGTDNQHAAIVSSKEMHFMENNGNIQLGEWVDCNIPQNEIETTMTHRNEVSLSEWCLPKTTCRDTCDIKKDGSEKALSSLGTLAPPISLKRADQNKLESMSKMYAKWMTSVCVSSNTKFEDSVKIREDIKKKDRNSTKQTNTTHMTREEKIMQVLQALQKHKEEKATSFGPNMPASSSKFSKSVNDIREDKADQDGCKFRRAVSGTYEHRLKAHKNVITYQKAKLEEQKRQIEDLKLSQLRMESEKSKAETQKTVNQVLESCDPRVKAQAKFLKSSLSLADLSPDNSFVLQMEQRASEQRRKKLLAQERRKQFEEEWKKRMKEAEERKHLEEEALIRKKHEDAQEMRRKERELREEARKEREKMIALERKAELFSQQRKLKKGFLAFTMLLSLRKAQEETAEKFYEEYLMRMVLRVWKREVETRLKARMACADNFYSLNLLRRCFDGLKEELAEGIGRMQVAVDMHDLHLQERCFHAWLKYNQEQQEIISEKMAKADDHFCKVVLRRYLCIWRRFPEVAQHEREKERRKMVWRNKVQQMLPDFRPLLSSD